MLCAIKGSCWKWPVPREVGRLLIGLLAFVFSSITFEKKEEACVLAIFSFPYSPDTAHWLYDFLSAHLSAESRVSRYSPVYARRQWLTGELCHFPKEPSAQLSYISKSIEKKTMVITCIYWSPTRGLRRHQGILNNHFISHQKHSTSADFHNKLLQWNVVKHLPYVSVSFDLNIALKNYF